MMTLKRIIWLAPLTLLLIFFDFQNSHAQTGQGNIWIFGNHAGLSFNTSPPQGFSGGQINNLEGCATISDSNGNLLFYTDGMTIWNKNHQVMETGLMGHNSSTQSGVIVPHPVSPDTFYVFTIDATQNYLQNGLRYTLVDMTLNNGLGDVPAGQKNIPLTPSGVKLAEKITAVRHCNNRDIWVIAHGYTRNPSNAGKKFYAFLITPAGVDTSAVVSTVGTEHKGGTNNGYGNSRGYMKASPDGRKIAVAITYDGCNYSFPNATPTWCPNSCGAVEVFDFNYTTGVVSNPVKLTGNLKGVYGLEFSPNGNVLYASGWSAYGGPNSIWQWNLAAGSASAIQNSMTTIVNLSSSTNGFGAMQLASDGKIYITRNNATYLSVINYPDKLGTSCGFSLTGPSVSPNRGRYGLPTFVQSYFNPNTGFSYSNNYEDEVTRFLIADSIRIDSVFWKFNDPNASQPDTSTKYNPTFKFSDTGTYNVLLVIYRCNIVDSIIHQVIIYPRPNTAFHINDTAQCLKDNLFVFTDSSTIESGSIASYHWDFGDGDTSNLKNPTHHYSKLGVFTVKLVTTSDHGGKDSLTKTVRIMTSPDASLFVNDTLQCFTNNIFYLVNTSTISSSSTLSYYWDFGNGDTSTSVFVPPVSYPAWDTFEIMLVAVSDSGCTDTVRQNVYVRPEPQAGFTVNDSQQCFHYQNFVFQDTTYIPYDNLNYLWYFGDGDTSTSKNPIHTYSTYDSFDVSLVVTSIYGCKDSTGHRVFVWPDPESKIYISDTTACFNENRFHFMDSSSISSGTWSTLWSFGDGDSSNVANPYHRYTSVDTFHAVLLVVSNHGCRDTSYQSVIVFPSPFSQFSVNDTSQCLNTQQFVFTNNSTLSSGTMSFIWDFGNGDTSHLINPQYTYSTHDTYTVKLIATSNLGCPDTSEQNLIVFPLPEVSFYIDDSSQCLTGNLFSFYDSSTILYGSNDSFYWMFGDGDTSLSRNTSHSYSFSDTMEVRLAIRSNYGCLDTATRKVVVHPMPDGQGDRAGLSTLNQGLVVYYPFGNNANDFSGNNLHATVYGAISNSGVKGNAYQFDGVNDYIEHIHNTAFVPGQRSWSVSLWFKTSLSGSEKTLLEWSRCHANSSCDSTDGAAYSLKLLSSGKLQFYLGDDSSGISGGYTLLSAKALNDNQWHFVTAVLDTRKDSIYLYIDNCLATKQKAVTSGITAGSVNIPLEIGRSLNGASSPGQYFSGMIDEIRIYHRALNHTEVNALYRYSRPMEIMAASSRACYTDSTYILIIHPQKNVRYRLYNAVSLNPLGPAQSSDCEDTLIFFTGSITDTSYFKILATDNITSCSRFLDTIIKIYNYPIPDADFAINDTDQCLTGNLFYFTNFSSISSGALTYYWDFGDSSTSTLMHPSHSYSQIGTFTVKLIITSDNQCKDSISRTIVVRPMPVADFSINDTDQCLTGNSFLFSNQSSISYGSVSLQWNLGDGNFDSQNNILHHYNQDDTFTVWLKATSNYGCSDSISRKVYVYPMPQAEFSVNDSTQCLKYNRFAFNNQSTISSGSLSQIWYFGDNQSDTVLNPIHSYNTFDSFSVLLVSISNQNCRDSAVKQIVVYPMPQASFYFNDSNQCLNTNSFETVNSSSIPYGSLIYYWDLGDGTSSNLSSPLHTYSNSDTFTVLLVATSNYGCSDSVTKKAYVFPNPVSGFSINDSQQCLNENRFVFSNNTSISSGSLSYYWNFGDNSQSNSIHPQHIYSSEGTYEVKLVVNSNLGCSDSVSHEITVFPSPKASFTINDSLQCFRNNLFTFTNLSSLSNGSLSYNWDFGDGDTSSSVNPVHVYSTWDTFDISLIARSNKNCPDTANSKVTVFPMPEAAFNIDDSSQCLSGNLFSFTNLSSIPYGSMSYVWDFGDSSGSSVATHPAYHYSYHDTFEVQLLAVSSQGCRDSISRWLIVDPMPQASFSVNDSSQCFKDNLFVLTNSTSIDYGSLNYQWSLGDGTFSTLINPVHSYSTYDTFLIQLKATSQKGCSDSFSRWVYVWPMPHANYSVNDTEQCLSNNLFVFTNLSTIPYGNMHAAWYFGDGDTSSSYHSSHAYNYFDTFLTRLIQISEFGCSDTSTQQVFVNPMPLADFQINDTAQCLRNNLFVLTNTSYLFKGNMYYDWQLSDSSQFNSTHVQHRFTYHDTFTIQLKVTSDRQCSDSLTRTVRVYPMPRARYFLYDSSQCFERNAFGFANQSTIDYGSLNYIWQFGDGDTSHAVNPIHSYAYADTFNVQLLAVSDKGCRDSVSGLTYVHVHPQPEAYFVVNDSAQCLRGNLFVFTDSTRIQAGYTSSYWRLGDGNSDSGSLINHTYSLDDTVEVWMTAVSDWGCKDSISRKVIIYPMPDAGFSINDSTQCYRNNDFILTNQSQINWGNLSYYWDFGDGTTDSIFQTHHSYSHDDTFLISLAVESSMGCRDTASHQVIVYPMPVASFSIDSSTQCFMGNEFHFTSLSSIKWGSLNYTWSFGDIDSANGISANHTYAKDDTFTVTHIVQSGMGCWDTTSQNVVVLPNPVSSFQVNDSTQCLNENLFEFQVNSTVPFGLMSYQWLMDNGDTLGYKNHNYHYTQPDSYLVRLITYSFYGCPDTASKTLIVHPSPVADFSVNNSRQCLNENRFEFNNLTSLLYGSFNSYWDFGNGDTSNALNPTYRYPMDSTYRVRLVVVSDYGCPDTVFHSMNVYPSPQAVFYTPANGQCLKGNRFQFINQSSISSGYMTYFWDFGDSTFSGNKDTAHTYHYPDTFNVVLIATSNHNCTDTAIANVVVHPMPHAGFVVNDSTQCLRYNLFAVTDTSTIRYGQLYSHWDMGDGTTGTSPVVHHRYKQYGTYRIQLVSESASGCFDTFSQNVHIYPMPVSSFTVNDSSQCLRGNKFEFFNHSQIPEGKLSYLWLFGDGAQSTSTNSIHSYDTANSFNVRLVAYSQKGCYDTSLATVWVRPMPEASFSINDSTQCLDGNQFRFTNHSQVAYGKLNYTWDFGDSQTDTSVNPVHSYLSDGFYSVMLSCFSEKYFCADTLVKQVVVHPMPVADFDYTVPCLLDTIRFTDKSTIGSPDFINQWYWDFSDGHKAIIQNPFNVFDTAGSYQVTLKVTSNHGCTDTKSKNLVFFELVDAPQLERATVTPENAVLVEWKPSQKGRPREYILEKSTDNVVFNKVTSTAPGTYAFTDQLTDVSSHSYIYRVKTIDSCNYESPYSNIGKTILLQVDESGEYPWLFWTEYKDWSSGIDYYRLDVNDYRQSKWVEIEKLHTLDYLDTRTRLNQAKYCYQITAIRNGDGLESRSNTVCAKTPLNVQVPNAFSPNGDGKNDTFLVSGTHILEFTLRIYDRWGELLFESNDVTRGWDGTFKGEPVPAGVYYYFIDARGTLYQKKRFQGTLTLIR